MNMNKNILHLVKDVALIKEAILEKHQMDEDCVLSTEDEAALVEYERDKAQGNLLTSEELRKELGLAPANR